TVGGIICGIQVVRLDGRPIDWATAVVRALSCFLSLAAAGLGFVWIAIDSDRQSWHDKIAGTVVVRLPKGASLI
ncbi:RDD family protein, partial [Staphylococcus aureus]